MKDFFKKNTSYFYYEIYNTVTKKINKIEIKSR